MKKTRNSSIEILRIIAMIFIIISHYSVHNGIDNNLIPLSINRIILDVATLGNIGVIIYVLITGYFQVSQEKTSVKKILKLYIAMLFYSITIYLIFVLLKLQPFSIKVLIQNMLPLTYNHYWFMTMYLILIILSPYFNKLLNALTEKEHRTFIIIMLIIFSLLPTITSKLFYSSEVVQFLMFYSIGAYFKKYNNNFFTSKKITITLIASTIALLVSPVLLITIKKYYPLLNVPTYFFFNRNSIIAILFSTSLFIKFIQRKEFENRFLNKLASCTLGVYLIHDNYLVRGIIWSKILKNYKYINTPYLIIHLIISVVFVFVVCSIIEFIRKSTIEKVTDKVLNKI